MKSFKIIRLTNIRLNLPKVNKKTTTIFLSLVDSVEFNHISFLWRRDFWTYPRNIHFHVSHQLKETTTDEPEVAGHVICSQVYSPKLLVPMFGQTGRSPIV